MLELLDTKVSLIPTQGCYQIELKAVLCGETQTEWRARVQGERYVRRFHKGDGMPVLLRDRVFPCYKLVIGNVK